MKPNKLPIGLDIEKYQYLIEDCKAIKIERGYNARTELIVAYGEIGERIYNDELYNKYTKGNAPFLERIFNDIGISRTDGYCAIQFYEEHIHGKFSDVSLAMETLFPKDAKTISWTKIKTKYLPAPIKEPKPEPKEAEEIYEKMMQDKKYAMRFIRGCIEGGIMGPAKLCANIATHEELADLLEKLETENTKLRCAIKWALGDNGEFRQRNTGEGMYWWREELANRADF